MSSGRLFIEQCYSVHCLESSSSDVTLCHAGAMEGSRADLVALVREMIRRTGKSQREIADSVGVNESTVSNWMTGRRFPRADTLAALAEMAGGHITLELSDGLGGRLAAVQSELSTEERGIIESVVAMCERRIAQQREAG